MTRSHTNANKPTTCIVLQTNHRIRREAISRRRLLIGVTVFRRAYEQFVLFTTNTYLNNKQHTQAQMLVHIWGLAANYSRKVAKRRIFHPVSARTRILEYFVPFFGRSRDFIYEELRAIWGCFQRATTHNEKNGQ